MNALDTTAPQHHLRLVAGLFRIYGDFVEAVPYGNGHINDTYAAVFNQSGRPVRYIFQRINHDVFKNPSAVMENVSRVTAHLRVRIEESGADQISRRVLTLVPALDGRAWDRDPAGNHWRCYLFIEKATTFDRIETTRQAFQAARAFGTFQKMLADLPAPRLRDTIPYFHHTRRRFDALRQAIEADACNRAVGAREEIGFCLRRESMVDVLLNLQASGVLPERVTHNDTKLDNVMIDDDTGEGICVIDLDTVMPGLVLNDFGDLCRTGARPTAEDERDLSRVEMRLDLFDALVRGYLASAGDFLCPAESDHLAFSAKLITFEIGLRFLSDHIEGDRYFKIHRPGQNADRARVQFKMVESFERHEDRMNRVVKEALSTRLHQAPVSFGS
jgi:hypothetical protein